MGVQAWGWEARRNGVGLRSAGVQGWGARSSGVRVRGAGVGVGA